MNLLGAPASRRPVESRKLKLAGETPALPGTAPRFSGSMREFVWEILTQQHVSRNAQTTDQGTDHFEAEASAPR